MHIVFVSRLSGYGGVAIHNQTISRKLAQMGHQVSVVTSRMVPEQPDRVVEDGVTIYSLLGHYSYRLSKFPLIGYYMRSIKLWNYSHRVSRTLIRISKEKPIDVVEFDDIDGEGFAYLRLKDRSPVVVRCQTPNFVLQDYYDPSERPYDVGMTIAMEKYAIRHADVITAPSCNMAQTIASKCGFEVDRIKVIPNALDTEKFAFTHTLSKTNRADDFTILHIGRMERIKGIGVLIDAIPLVLYKIPNARFVFIGPANSKEEMNIWEHKLVATGKDRVLLLGFLEHSKMVEYYQKADIILVPSINYESFSYTCAQAMASGLPVIASRIGGIPETVGDDIGGILVPPGNSELLADAIIRLARNPDLRKKIGAAARERAESLFAAGKVASRMLEVYQDVIGG
ncbi:MAG: glycosyltransferase family 4 protein [Chloroflexota bacterium]